MIDFERKEHYGLSDLLHIVALLRSEGGCPWDRVQTHASLRRSLLEEAYEAVEAIDEKSSELLKEELGDLLLQVVFHADIERQAGDFTMDDVADGEVRKMLFRHPHVFGGQETVQDADTVLEGWEAIKRREKGQQTTAQALDACRDCGGRRSSRARPPVTGSTGRTSPGRWTSWTRRYPSCTGPPPETAT
mgnify:CR=1 FL=1